MSSRWTEGQLQKLGIAYTEGMPIDKMSLLLKKSIRAIRIKLSRLNVKGRNRVWTEEGLRKRKDSSQYWARESELGKVSWNTGLTKETDERLRQSGQVVSKSILANPEARAARSKLMRNYNLNQKDYSQPWNRGMKPWAWMNMSEEDFYSMVSEAQARKPTSLERKMLTLIEKCQLPFRYVGDGQVWIAGKCPDFINTNGEKQLIEVFGDYWHSPEDEAERTNHYARYGFQTLVLWEHDLKKLSEDEIIKLLEKTPFKEGPNGIQSAHLHLGRNL